MKVTTFTAVVLVLSALISCTAVATDTLVHVDIEDLSAGRILTTTSR